MKCRFNIAWVGFCHEKGPTEFCSFHSGLKCCVCGEQATQECPETFQFVCGFLLCDNHHHIFTTENRIAHGMNGVELTGYDIPYPLRPDSPPLAQCNRCFRQTWDSDQVGTEDRMTQPDGNPCGGRFV